MENKMQNHKLRNGNPGVSVLGLDCMGMSFGYGFVADKKLMITGMAGYKSNGKCPFINGILSFQLSILSPILEFNPLK